MRRIGVKLSAVGVFELGHITGIFDHRDLHTQTEAKIGSAFLSCVFCCRNFALSATISESAGDQDAIK